MLYPFWRVAQIVAQEKVSCSCVAKSPILVDIPIGCVDGSGSEGENPDDQSHVFTGNGVDKAGKDHKKSRRVFERIEDMGMNVLEVAIIESTNALQKSPQSWKKGQAGANEPVCLGETNIG